MSGNRQDYDIAHACFLTGGVSLLAIGMLSTIPMGTGAAGGVGFFVAIPLFVVGVLSMFVGVGFSLKLNDSPTLIVLSGLSIAYVIQFFAELGPVWFRNAGSILYGALVIVVCGIWFARLRRSYR